MSERIPYLQYGTDKTLVKGRVYNSILMLEIVYAGMACVVSFGLVHIAVQFHTGEGSPSFSLSCCNARAIHVASQKC